jgi:dethiobiotin synthetase
VNETVLVTGTDAGVGTTWVACGLARTLRRAGRPVVAVKVVETGWHAGEPDTEDGARLAAATGQPQPLHALRRFRASTTPAAAAELEGLTLDLDELAAEVETTARDSEIMLLEGSGGLLAPFGWDWNIVDLAQAFEATALVVASDRLGAVNHTLLNLSALDLAGLRVAGIILNAPPQPDETTGTNATAIARISGIDRVREVPRLVGWEETSPWLTEVLGWL